MAKRRTKQKAGQQKSKKKKSRGSGGSSAEGAKGTMSGMRGGFANMFGGRLFDLVLWAAVIGAGYFFVSQRCTGTN